MWALVLFALICGNDATSEICASLGSISYSCVPISTCPKLSVKISSISTTRDKVRHLQSLTCGFEHTEPKVCCQKANMAGTFANVVNQVITAKNSLPMFKDCGENIDASDYILGGRTPEAGTYPWVARLSYKALDEPTFEYICGGTLISKRFVLLASHCFFTLEPTRYIVRLGEYNTKVKEINEEDYHVKRIITHEHYDMLTKHNDIALIELDKPVKLTAFVRPVCLPVLDKFNLTDLVSVGKLPAEAKGEVLGFGKTDNSLESKDSETLQVLEVPIVSNSICQKIYEGKATITSKQMCAGGVEGQDSCKGDSGGGLFIKDQMTKRYFQIGIVSFGPKICGLDGYPGIYTRISSYIDWILKSIAEMSN